MAWLGIGVTPGCGAVTRAATEGAAGVSPAVAAESPGDGAATDSPEGGGGAGRREGGEGGMDAIALRGGGGADPIARAFSGGGGGNLLADIGAREAVGGSGVLPASAGRGGRLGGAPATLGNGGREPTRGGTGTGPRDGGGGGADPLRGGRSPVELGGAGATSSKMSESSISSSDSCCSRSVPARSDALLEFLPAPGRGTNDFGRLALSPLPRVAFAFLARPSPAGRGGETAGAADPDAPFPLSSAAPFPLSSAAPFPLSSALASASPLASSSDELTCAFVSSEVEDASDLTSGEAESAELADASAELSDDEVVVVSDLASDMRAKPITK